MASLPRSRGTKSNNGRGTHSSTSDDDPESLPLSAAGGMPNSNTVVPRAAGGNSLLNKPLSTHHSASHSNTRIISFIILIATACACIALFGFLLSSTATTAANRRPYTANGKRNTQNWPFITVQGNNFMQGCRPFFVTGINVDNLVEAAIVDVSEVAEVQGPEGIPGREMVRNLLQNAAEKGMNVVRTWAHTTDPGHPLQDRPGVYVPDAFEALDYIIAEAEAVGIRVQLSFVDMWRYRGGISEFVDWSTTAPQRDTVRYPPLIVEGDVTPEMMTEEREAYENTRRALFYTDPDAKSMYKAHVTAILTRKNVFTGKIYREDPTIFGFGLLNEPRCDVFAIPECADLLQNWIEEMAVYFREYDTVHLLTVGEEGFYGLNDSSENVNPGVVGGSRWAAASGQDFIRNHQVPGISYAAMHAWPDNWFSNDTGEFITTWIEQHARDAETRLQMPVLLEEVGKKVEPAPGTANQLATIRDPVYKTVFKAVEHSMAHFGALQGSMLWQMEFRLYNQSPSTPYGVKFDDSTFALVEKHAARVKTHSLTHPLMYSNHFSSGSTPSEIQQNENNKNNVVGEAGCDSLSPCWVGNSMALGWIRRCSHRGAVRRQIQKSFDSMNSAAALSRWDNVDGTFAPPLGKISKKFASKEECCAAESGAFATGCTSWLF